jgi:dTDP-4-dehydrorhamnose 3,5-epimerase
MTSQQHVGDTRPAFLIIPVGAWHGLQNLGSTDALLLNFPTRGYDYQDPDPYRLPRDTDQIPYSWNTHAATRLPSDRVASD